jgi:predicted MPP superfamily phosphohydrolase
MVLVVSLLTERSSATSPAGSAKSIRQIATQAEVRWERHGPWLQFFVPSRFSWGQADIAIPGLPEALDGLRIVHLTDMHFRGYWSRWYDRVLDRVEAAQPDLVLLTGDFVDHQHDHRPALTVVERFVTRLKGRLGTYAVLGNHDGDLIGAHFKAWGLTLINGRVVRLRGEEATIEIIGLHGCDREDIDARFPDAIAPKPDNAVRIVLTHFPDWLPKARTLGADLMLAGHTHGGQVCLPWGSPIYTHDSLPKRMSHGVHRVGGTWLAVGRGVGFSGLPVRAFCPAEGMELVLRRG